MRKYGMFAFLFALIAFSSKISFADEMGGGAGDDAGGEDNQGEGGSNENDTNENSGDIGDIELDDEADESSNTPLTADERAEFRAMQAQNKQTEMLASLEGSIKTRVPEFSMSAVVDGLKELHKSDPAKAAYYNASEAGLEAYHRDHLANVAKGDNVNSGSHSGGGSDMESVLEKARGGHKASQREALARSKA